MEDTSEKETKLKTKRSSQFDRIKKRLVSLVGTDVIRLNDRYYIERLIAGLVKEYNVNEDKREKGLAAAEIERIRKLKLDGLPVPKDSGSSKSKRKLRKKKKRQQRPKTANTCVADVDGRLQLESYMTTRRHISQPERRWSATNRTLDLLDTVSEADSRTVMSSDEEEDDISIAPKQSATRTTHNTKKEPEVLRRLREEETVAGLYAIAERLIGAPPKDKKPQIKVTHQVDEDLY